MHCSFVCFLQPISIIAPFHQGNRQLTATQKKLSFIPCPALRPFNPSLKRNQSFAGFQSNNKREPQLPWATQYSIFMRNVNQVLLGSTPTLQAFNPVVMQHQAFAANPSFQNNQYYQPLGAKRPPGRVSGRNEASFQLKKCQEVEAKPKKVVLTAKRFNSLKTEKHKCYSPTFYSMRCKKHAKKRPIVYALPKKCLTASKEGSNDFQNLTDSIQILEENTVTPIPAPRCKKHKTPEIIYANICESLSQGNDSPSSSDASTDQVEQTTAEVEVHQPPEPSPPQETTKPRVVDHSPKLVAVVPKISTQAMKNSPILKVSPNFVKPKVESPKGALSLKIQAKIKGASPCSNSAKSEEKKETIDTTIDIPQMPLITPKSPKLEPSLACTNAALPSQVCFIFVYCYVMH